MAWCAVIVPKLLGARIVFIVGKFLIGKVMNTLDKNRGIAKLDGAVRSFSMSAIKGALYVILFVTIINIMGVPMASVVAVIASAGVAVGLALQGALSNLAGGIMLVLFKPFRVGDYVDAAGVSGTVKEVTLFYTVIMTLDNRRVTVPDGCYERKQNGTAGSCSICPFIRRHQRIHAVYRTRMVQKRRLLGCIL